jgi:hypothetical protein
MLTFHPATSTCEALGLAGLVTVDGVPAAPRGDIAAGLEVGLAEDAADSGEVIELVVLGHDAS